MTQTVGLTQYFSKYCSVCNQEVATTTQEIPTRTDGLTIPEVGISIRLGQVVSGVDDSSLAQKYVDAPDCGVYFVTDNAVFIGDHNFQGFSKMIMEII